MVRDLPAVENKNIDDGFSRDVLPESSKASPLKEILDFNAKALGKSAQLPSKNLSFWPA
jgi:hypothetical protein